MVIFLLFFLVYIYIFIYKYKGEKRFHFEEGGPINISVCAGENASLDSLSERTFLLQETVIVNIIFLSPLFFPLFTTIFILQYLQ